MNSRLARIVRADATLAMSTRATQGAAMGIAAFVVIWRTSPDAQGFYFAFISFGLLLQLCDFGLSYASLQAASHLLALGRTGELPALADRAMRINAMVTMAATTIVATGGWWIFARAPADHGTAWQVAWLAFIVGVGMNHLTAPWLSLVEGGVSVGQAWRFRLRQEAASGVALLVVLAAGEALWSLVAYFWTRGLFAFVWMRTKPLAPSTGPVVSLSWQRWRDELWPFQWRVGLSAIAGYLVFQAFGPILFALRGPAEAGRFALSLSVMNALVMVTTAWPVSQAAHFGVLLGRRQGRDLSTRWLGLLWQSTAFALVGAGCALAGFLLLDRYRPDLTSRFAGPTATALLIASAVAHHVVACISVVLRSERRDPLLPLGLVGGLVTLGSMTLAAALGHLTWIATAYLACTAATVPVAYAVYRRFALRQRFA